MTRAEAGDGERFTQQRSCAIIVRFEWKRKELTWKKTRRRRVAPSSRLV
jgi:hypothetical protein